MDSTTTKSSSRGVKSVQPINSRPPPTPEGWTRFLLFNTFFLVVMIGVHCSQIIAQSLYHIFSFLFGPPEKNEPHWKVKGRYIFLNEWDPRRWHTICKRLFALTLLFIINIFAPTKLVITAEPGFELSKRVTLTEEEEEEVGDRGGKKIQGLKLPDRMVLTSNHQIYLDWCYLWSLLYHSRAPPSSSATISTSSSKTTEYLQSQEALDRYLYIILKGSLLKAPIVGLSMKWFGFIFLSRAWEKDKETLGKHLTRLANEASPAIGTSGSGTVTSGTITPVRTFAEAGEKLGTDRDGFGLGGENNGEENENEKKLCLLIYPEGTVVSPTTRVVSGKYATKMGLAEPRHMLLPRSTGLLFCLRSLRARIPDLGLVDCTVGYEGIPKGENGQEYYTLQSAFGYGQPPPAIHIHLRSFIPTPTPSSSSTSFPADSVPLPSPSSAPLSPTVPIGQLNSSAASSTASTPITEKESEIIPSPGKRRKFPSSLVGGKATQEEAQAFDEWLRARWSEKDDLMEYFYAHGEFIPLDQLKNFNDNHGDDASKNENEDVERYELDLKIRFSKDWWWFGMIFVIGWYSIKSLIWTVWLALKLVGLIRLIIGR